MRKLRHKELILSETCWSCLRPAMGRWLLIYRSWVSWGPTRYDLGHIHTVHSFI